VRTVDSARLGDSPYVIDALNLDRYPLVQSNITPPTVTPDAHVEFAIVAVAMIVLAVVAVTIFRRKKKTKIPGKPRLSVHGILGFVEILLNLPLISMLKEKTDDSRCRM
jgi:hypothetical protein